MGGTADDTTLLRPRLIAARRGRLFVYDYGDHAVKSFDDRGYLTWRAGRSGKGPWEFANPFDLEVGADGSVWVLDVVTARVTRLSSGGSRARLFEVPTNARSLVPLANTAIVITSSLEQFWIEVTLDGDRLATGPSPLRQLRDVHPPARQPLASGAPGRTRWAVVFPFGDVLLVYTGRQLHCTGQLVEAEPFPPVPVPDAPIWAAAVAATDSAIYVLARGQTAQRLRLLDVYSPADCRYRSTHLLPRRMSALAVSDGVFYFAYEDPTPTIVGLRPRPR